jgi:hypothetical protein
VLACSSKACASYYLVMNSWVMNLITNSWIWCVYLLESIPYVPVLVRLNIFVIDWSPIAIVNYYKGIWLSSFMGMCCTSWGGVEPLLQC